MNRFGTELYKITMNGTTLVYIENYFVRILYFLSLMLYTIILSLLQIHSSNFKLKPIINSIFEYSSSVIECKSLDLESVNISAILDYFMGTSIAYVFSCAGSFHCSYPTWEPKAEGKEFLLNLRKFRDQMLQGQGTKPAYLPPKMQQWSSNLRGLLDRNGFLSRDNIPVADRQLGSAWMIDAGQRNYPYILDWYYTSRPHNATGNSRDVPAGHFHDAEAGSRDFWTPLHLPRTEAMYEENWAHRFVDRSQSHLGTSTSASLFPQSVLQHNDLNNTAHHGKSQWWARSRPHGLDPQTSFLEPPNFGHNAGIDHPQTRSFIEPPNFSHNTPNNYHDNFSDGSLEEEEQQFGWSSSHRLSRTFYMDDLEGGEFNLPFDDIYGRPPESPSTNHDPTSFVG